MRPKTVRLHTVNEEEDLYAKIGECSSDTGQRDNSKQEQVPVLKICYILD